MLISIKEILNGKLHLFVQCNGQNCKTWRKCYVLYYDKLTSYLKSSLCSHVRATDTKMVQEIIAKSTSEERNICSSWFWHLICCYQKSFLTLWVTVNINLRLPSLVFDKKKLFFRFETFWNLYLFYTLSENSIKICWEVFLYSCFCHAKQSKVYQQFDFFSKSTIVFKIL